MRITKKGDGTTKHCMFRTQIYARPENFTHPTDVTFRRSVKNKKLFMSLGKGYMVVTLPQVFVFFVSLKEAPKLPTSDMLDIVSDSMQKTSRTISGTSKADTTKGSQAP